MMQGRAMPAGKVTEMEGEVFVGIDVSKFELDVAILPGEEVFSVANERGGIASLVRRLGELAPVCVVMEATGGYELAAATELWAAGIKVAVVNPGRARSFARGVGQLAKSDSLDARNLASFAQLVRPPYRPLADQQSRELMALIARRRQLVEMLVAEGHRREHAEKCVRSSLAQSLRALEK
jgi:transposase